MRRELRSMSVRLTEQSRNLLIEGENLQTMVTLYKYRGEVDSIVTDPPYNTGQYFRYNDKWDEDPNDPDLGTVVAKEDGSRHTKWIKAMMPRLQMMKAMLKPSGVIAICIDDNELLPSRHVDGRRRLEKKTASGIMKLAESSGSSA